MNKLYNQKQSDMFIIRKQACEHNLVLPVTFKKPQPWDS